MGKKSKAETPFKEYLPLSLLAQCETNILLGRLVNLTPPGDESSTITAEDIASYLYELEAKAEDLRAAK